MIFSREGGVLRGLVRDWFLSRCGREFGFLRSEARPLV